ncbi:MAG: GAF domain-containing protein, partial [Anaerolineales bacterium]
MSTSPPRPPLRPRIPYGLSVITLVLLTLGLGAEILILANFFQLNQAAAISEVSTELLPQLSALRIDVLRLDAETQAIFRTEQPDIIALENQRRSAAANLASLRILTIGQAHYQPALDAVDALLRTHDAQLATFQRAPSATQLAALTAELQNSFREAEAALDALALNEEGQFYSATESTLVTVRNIQVILLSASVVILFLGAVLIVTIRQSAQSEISRAYSRLQVAAEVGQAASSILNLDELFATSLNLIRDRFGYYHASIFLLDEQGEQAILRGSTGEIGRQLKERGHRLAVGSNSLIGWVTAHHTPRVALDVGEDPLHFKNERLPDTRSELALPLLAGGQLLGALDVHSLEADAFDDVDLGVLQTLADQIAVAIANATQYGSEQARSRQMAALSEAAAELTGPPQRSEVLLDVIARRALKLLRAEGVGLWVPAGADAIELKVAHDLQSAEAVERGLPAPKSNLINHLHAIGRTLRVDDYLAWAGRSDAAMPFEAALAVPITWQEAVVGVLTLVHLRPGQV